MAIGLGVIGAGSAIRRLHLPVLRKMPEQFQIVALASRSRASAEAMAHEIGGVRVHDDYRALLEDPAVEAVLTSVPVELNGRVLTDAVRAGKHVLAEKPLAATLEEARDVMDACRGSAGVVAIAENFRYREDVVRAHELVTAGELGQVYGFKMTTLYDIGAEPRRKWFAEGTWRHKSAFPGGMITDTGVHMISSLRDILGEVGGVYAQALNVTARTTGPDFCAAQFTMKSGAVGQFLASFAAKVARETVLELTVLGTAGSLHLAEGEVVWVRTGSEPAAFRPKSFDRGYTPQWGNFYRAIRGAEALRSTVEEAYRDLEVVDAVLRSMEVGRWVELG